MLLTPIPGLSTVPGAADYVGGADDVFVSNFANSSMKHNYFGTYFQDDIKVTPKLTVNLGLRWEYFGQLIENYGAQSNFLPSGSNGSSTFLMTKKRCNTPLSPDFYAAAQADNINIVCSESARAWRIAKTQFCASRGVCVSADAEVRDSRRLRYFLRRV